MAVADKCGMFAKTLMLLGLVGKQRKIYTYTCYWKDSGGEKRPRGDQGEEVYTQVFPVSHGCRRPCSVYTEPILLLSPSGNSHCITGRAPESICLCYVLSPRRVSWQKESGLATALGWFCKHWQYQKRHFFDQKLSPRGQKLQEALLTTPKATRLTPKKYEIQEDAGRSTSMPGSPAAIFMHYTPLYFTVPLHNTYLTSCLLFSFRNDAN